MFLFSSAWKVPRASGFTLVEVLVGSAVFLMVAVAVYEGYLSISRAVSMARYKVVATALANERFEIMRNMPYADVGVNGSIPAGSIPREETVVRDGTSFIVTTTIRNIDDPFDGLLGETPNDTSPADYKLVQVDIECAACKNFAPFSVTGRVAPKNLETASNNGALFIQVIDGSGLPVQGASVHVENNAVPIAIDDVTNAQGMLQLVDVPPAIQAYEITASKDGYSSSQTYSSSTVANPLQPHATVVLQAVTQASFAIDKLSTIRLSSVTPSCASIGNVDFLFQGSKLVGMNPDVPKHSYVLTTGSSGSYSSTTIEWDSYTVSLAGPTYDIVGTNAVNPVLIAPDSETDIEMILAPKDPKTLLVSVKDMGTGLPVSGAEVSIGGPVAVTTKTTGRGYINQTDWSGGGGQATSTDTASYFSSDGRIEDNLPAGELRLKNILGQFESFGVLESSTFDTGSASNFHEIVWNPYGQPVTAGTESVRFQVAANNDTTTWNFVGPDDTDASYFTASDRNLTSFFDGKRFFRYKAFLSTDDTLTTPNVADVAFTFTSECTPPGQVAWSGLPAGTYDITATKSGYQMHTSTYELSGDWAYYEVVLVPE